MMGLLFLPLHAFANCGNDNGNGNGCSNNGAVGPQGPAGANGSNGTNGTNGNNGINGANGASGTNGTNGTNGKDATTSFHGTSLVLDAAVRLYDGKRIQLQAFDTYVLGSHSGQDVIGDGMNTTVGMRVVFKLGSSYEEREIAKLKKLLGVK